MKRAIVLIVLVVAIGQLTASAQCAMCRTALESSPEGQALAGSFRHGILMLMGAPYLMLSAAGFAVYRAYRKKNPPKP